MLGLSREARWTFPSSYGLPAAPDELSVLSLVAERGRLPETAQALDDEEAIELAANAWRAWMVERDLGGGRRFVDEILARGGEPSRSRSLALYGSGLFALRADDRAASLARNAEALEIAQAVGDREALALANLGLARVALEDGDHEAARTLAVEAREHAGETALGQAPLHIHAQALRQGGDYDGAAELFADSLALNRRVGDEGMVEVELQNLSVVELHRGHHETALRLLEELAPGDDYPFGAGVLAYARGDAARARSLLGEVDREELPQDDQAELDWLRAELG